MFRIRAPTICAHDRTPRDPPATAPLSRSLDRVFQRAQALDLDSRAVARLHEDRRLARITDAGRRAGRDYVAGLEREDLREKRDQVIGLEDQVASVGVLHALAVEVERELE